MAQQIINIPINWDDDAIERCIEQGVIAEVKKELIRSATDRLGIGRHWGYSDLFNDIVRECIRETIKEHEGKILTEITNRGFKSLINSKAYKEVKGELFESAK